MKWRFDRPLPDLKTGAKDHRRLVILYIFIAIGFCLLILQFFKLQITEGKKWKKIAQSQHEVVVPEPSKRGTFYPNNGLSTIHSENFLPFAVDILKYHLYIDPSQIPEDKKEIVSSKIAQLLRVDQKEQEEMTAQFYKTSRSRKVKTWLSRENRGLVLEWWLPFARKNKIASNAIYFVADYERSYPYGKMLGQVLHTIRDLKDEKTGSAIPTGGLEAYFNRYLQGKDGRRKLTRALHTPLDMGRLIEKPIQGADVYLTINPVLQAIAEEEIERGVKAAQAKEGWAIMMDPYTGEILALAQYPFFDPKNYVDYFNDPQKMNFTKVRGITDPYEPGSSMKAITASLALLANEELKAQGKPPCYDPDEVLPVTNGFFPGRSTPIVDTMPVKYANLNVAIQKSSNIYVGRVIDRVLKSLGNEWYRRKLQEVFGFGVKTGIELSGETAGKVPTPGKLHPNGTLEWSLSTPYSLAMGYNIQVNSVQMLRAFAVLANGGYLVEPTLVRKIVRQKSNGEKEILLDNTNPKRMKRFPKVLNEAIIDRVVTAMKYTTKAGGNCPRAEIWGYTEAGKTSTSRKLVNGQYSRTNYFCAFHGFVPATHARFVLLVAIDLPRPYFIPGVGNNHHGSQSAAPVFQKISERALQYLGVVPDDPYGYPPGDPRRDPEKADWVKKADQLNALRAQWEGKRLQ